MAKRHLILKKHGRVIIKKYSFIIGDVVLLLSESVSRNSHKANMNQMHKMWTNIICYLNVQTKRVVVTKLCYQRNAFLFRICTM